MRQALPLKYKVELTKTRIREWYRHYNGKVYVSFSGGKDSTVLLHIVRSIYPDVEAVFCDTGLEFPEIREFIRTIDNVTYLRPKMNFKQVIEKYGYPVISKETAEKINDIRNTKSEKQRNRRMYGDSKGNGKVSKKWLFLKDAPFKISSYCCNIMKKQPVKRLEKENDKKPFIGTMAWESALRKTAYYQFGCNAFDKKRPTSQPLSFWTEQDIWDYIKEYDISYSKIYDMGYERTGCIWCIFGSHLEKEPNRFQRLKQTHPQLHKYCMEELGLKEVLDYINVKSE
jgi:3'-phosphoadenosine 5'-phosphosulfate sulfotransferase (PAPS reductase)/FAD synthetase